MKRVWSCLAVLVMLMGLLPGGVQAVELDVEGKSALLMDAATGTVLYEKNAHEALPPASVTKVMTMLLIMEAIDSGKIGYSDQVTASDNAAAKGGSQIYLKAGESMTVSDMLKSIAVSSANDCACAMAEHIAGSESAFVDAMNARAKELGMEDTHFVNCTGLDDDAEAASHLTSAYDIALMSRALLSHPDITKYTTIWMDTVRDGAFGLANTNKMVRFYSGCTGLKTGFTSGAGYCLSASAQREGLTLIAVVMGAETSAKRFAACKTMLDYGFANFALVEPAVEEEAAVKVILGKEKSVPAVPGENAPLLIDKGSVRSISFRVSLEKSVEAPVSAGQRLGTLTVLCGEQVLREIPMVAQRSVERLGFWELFLRMLSRVSGAATDDT